MGRSRSSSTPNETPWSRRRTLAARAQPQIDFAASAQAAEVRLAGRHWSSGDAAMAPQPQLAKHARPAAPALAWRAVAGANVSRPFEQAAGSRASVFSAAACTRAAARIAPPEKNGATPCERGGCVLCLCIRASPIFSYRCQTTKQISLSLSQMPALHVPNNSNYLSSTT